MRDKRVSMPMILIVAIANLALLSGCGSSSANQATPPPQAIVVTVLPSNNVSIQVGQSQQFTATVQNDPSNRGVTWSIGTSGCTAALCGAIDATGKFTTSATFHSSFNNCINRRYFRGGPYENRCGCGIDQITNCGERDAGKHFPSSRAIAAIHRHRSERSVKQWSHLEHRNFRLHRDALRHG